VHETLYFAAMLRLPSHMTRAQKLDRVDGVIASLGLRRCRDTIIGGFFRRGVSGGERKRVSVGHELLVNPSLLLLDEPTSGLDSTTAMHLLRLLSRLAGGGRAVVTTIHQPSSRLYHQLDKVLLLSQGRAAYYGAAAAAGEWCAQLGHPVPFGTNLADWLLDLSSGEVEAPGGGGKGGEGPEAEARGEEERGRLVATAEAFLRAHPDGFAQGMGVDKVDKVDAAAAAGDDGGAESLGSRASSAAEGPPAAVVAVGGLRALLGRKTHAAAAADADLESGGGGGGGGGRGRAVLRSQTTLAAARPGASRWGASYGTQLRILFVRAVRVRRFESLAAQDVAQFSIVGLVAGMIWWQVGKGQTLASAQDTLGLLFFEALFLGFRSLFSALFTFPQASVRAAAALPGRRLRRGHGRAAPSSARALLLPLLRCSSDAPRPLHPPRGAISRPAGAQDDAQGARLGHVPPLGLLPRPHRLRPAHRVRQPLHPGHRVLPVRRPAPGAVVFRQFLRLPSLHTGERPLPCLACMCTNHRRPGDLVLMQRTSVV
jgi:energy-coupling factor transporter ATP-binding protein EcfA2